MRKKDSSDNYFKESYSVVWNQYRLFYDEIGRYDNKFQLSLAFVGILIAIYFNLKLNLIQYNNYILIGYFLAIILSLYQMIPRKMWFPLIDEKRINEMKGKSENLFKLAKEDIFGVGFHINRCRINKRFSLIILLNLIIITSGLFAVNSYCYFQNKTMLISSAILMIIILILVNYFYNREYNVLNL
jgi:hypothetical protein